MERAKVDVIVMDTAHGHTARVLKAVRELKKKLKKVDLVVGNIASGEAGSENWGIWAWTVSRWAWDPGVFAPLVWSREPEFPKSRPS